MKNPTLFKKSSTQMGGGKLLLISILTPFFMFAQNQQNTLPTTGNVGVGTTSPDVKLQVNGRMRVDSSLLVMDSAVFEKRAHIKDRIVVDEDAIIKGKLVARDKLKVKGTAKFEGNIKVNSNAKFLGNVKFPNLSTINSNDTTLLFINANGKLKQGSIVKLIEQVGSSPQAIPILQGIIYSNPVLCLQDPNGGAVYTPPSWERDAQRMFILNKACHPDVRLGVGVKPKAKFHIFTDNSSILSQILIEKQSAGGTTDKLMELDKVGNLYTHTLSLSSMYVATNTFAKFHILADNNSTLPQILVEKQSVGGTTEKLMELDKNGELYARSLSIGNIYMAPNTYSQLTVKNANRGASIMIDATGNSWDYNKLIFAKFDGNETTEIFAIKKEGENAYRFYMKADGSFYIHNGTKKLLQMDNGGVIRSRRIIVDLQTWPDFVFEKDYKLPSLKATEQYIKQNGHLPNVPSAKEVTKNGLDLGEMNKILLQKVEELTLHLIAQEKRIAELEQKVVNNTNQK